jgi:[protein-PII] uridylyltransferase
MYRIQNRRAIINRKTLLAALSEACERQGASRSRASALKAIKAALRHGGDEVRRRFESGEVGGLDAVHAQSFLIDQIVRSIYDVASRRLFSRAGAEDAISIVATGGYGRGELAPFSDIDLMFLVPSGADGETEALVEYLLYMLWDAGLKVGHATRSVDDCIRLAREDLSIRTSLLEARWLWGDKEPFSAFETRFRRELIDGSGRQFVEEKLRERDARHDRMGDSRYVLEPHIKEGKGGLRDLQTLFWLAKYLYHVTKMNELVSLGVFTAADARHFRKAQQFLWTVRCHLHLVAGRPEERLTFDVQGIIGARLGYTERSAARGVERFMKHYFHVTKSVGDLTRVLCAVLEDDHSQPRLRFRLPSLDIFRRVPAGFQLVGDRVMVERADLFEHDPVQILRIFHEAQRMGRDIHPKALRLAQQNLKRIDATVREDPEANRLFMEILAAEIDPEPALRRLNEAGVFGRFIPDFGRVVAQMQYDMYHHFTVDEHSIRAIGILGRIERGELIEEHPTATRIFGEVRSRRALYLAVLLHDVAKGRGGDHSVLGAEMALRLAPRLGLDEWETETVSWLIRHHLLLSRFAFKRDVDDPKTVADLNAVVQSPERLRMLLILTNADVSAVGPGVWNAWKEGLLSELFYRAMEALEMTGGQPLERSASRVEQAKSRLRETLAHWDAEELDAYMERGSSDYWLAHDADEHSRHFELMRRADANGGLRVEADANARRDATRVTVYASDRSGLFAQLAGAIALGGASIVDAKAATLANAMALDVLHVQDFNGGPLDDGERASRLVRRIEAALTGQSRPSQELEAARRRALRSRTEVFRVPSRVIFDNLASTTHTVIEVNGRDRPGFLHDVTSALTRLGLQIASAHISTYGERVVDVFYVKDTYGLKVEDRQRLDRVERVLLEAMAGAGAAGPPDAPVGKADAEGSADPSDRAALP